MTRMPEWSSGATWDHDDEADAGTLVGLVLSAYQGRRRVGVELHHARYPHDSGIAVLDVAGRVRGLELPADVLVRAVVALWPDLVKEVADAGTSDR